jgi:hypothetical protein
MISFLPVKHYLFLIIIVTLMGSLSPAYADENSDDIQQRIEELQREAEQTTDLNRLMEIASELTELMASMPTPGDMGGEIPESLATTGRGKTPDEEVNRVIAALNYSYVQGKKALAGFRDPEAPLVPVSRARKLQGSITVNGTNRKQPGETPYNGNVSKTLDYTIQEDYVGYLVIQEYYDPRTGKYVDKKDYSIGSISQKIKVPFFAGKECVEIEQDWRNCKRWEKYASYRLAGGDTYPAIHDWVVLGSPEEGSVKIKVETPDVIFATFNRGEQRGQGCFGAKFSISNDEFASDIEDNKITRQKSVGHEFHGTPHCGLGSTVSMQVQLCKEVPRCEQLQDLLKNIFWAIELRDSYGRYASEAESDQNLHDLVSLDINERHPNMDIADKEFLEKYSAGFNPASGEMTIPNLCEGCAARPLCQWNMDGLRAHEKIHKADIEANPDLRRLFTDTLYQQQNYTANQLDRAQAQATGELEVHAYDENARYLMDILDRELNQGLPCDLPSSFYVDLQRAKDALK